MATPCVEVFLPPAVATNSSNGVLVPPPEALTTAAAPPSGGSKKARRRKRTKAKRQQTQACEDDYPGYDDEDEDGGGQPVTTQVSNDLLQRTRWPVEVRYARGRGRYAVAARAVAAGAVVLRERAFASAVAAPQQEFACHACFRYDGGTPLRHTCPHCRQVSFCSPACAAPQPGRLVHPKAECEALQRLHNCHLKGFSVDEVAEVRLLIRIMVMRWIATQKRSGDEGAPQPVHTGEDTPDAADTLETSFANFMELMSNKHNFGSAATNRFRQRAFLVVEAFSSDRASRATTNDVLQGLDVDEIVEYIGRLESNTFARYHTSKKKTVNYGSALFSCAAMFNHSCFPSVVRQFDGQYLTLRALRPLKQGDELTMTYIPLREDTSERQHELQQHYHFTCQCQRCEARGAEVERYMETCLLCPNDTRECDGLLVCLDDDGAEGIPNDPQAPADTTTTTIRKQHCLACGFTRDIDTNLLTPAFATK